MSTGTFIFCSALVVLCGFLAQQSAETFINTWLTFSPFNIKTVS